MYFLIVYRDEDGSLMFDKVSKDALLNRYEFGSFLANVSRFIIKAGIGDYLPLRQTEGDSSCIIIRTA